MSLRVKICGLTRPDHVTAAVQAGAAYVGFVLFPKSPRNLTLAQARDLALEVPPGVARVALTVDMAEADLDAAVDALPIDMIQLHGHETPEDVARIRARYGLPVMKAVGVADEGDLPALDDFLRVADQVLVDAKPPKGAPVPGGNGVAFDWRLISNRRWPRPWMLAGGLTPANVAQAVRLTGAKQVDVSSGVESAPGVKDPALIRAFLTAARG